MKRNELVVGQVFAHQDHRGDAEVTTPTDYDHDSPYWRGRVAHGRSNAWSSKDCKVEHVKEHLREALAALDGATPIWQDDTEHVGLGDMEKIAAAYNAIHELTRFLPPVEAWACYTTYRNGFGGPGRYVVWSAHTSREDAEKWLPMWQKRYADRTDYEWHVGLVLCDVKNFHHPDDTPERHNQRMGSR